MRLQMSVLAICMVLCFAWFALAQVPTAQIKNRFDPVAVKILSYIPQAQNQALYKKPAYDSTRDFVSVGLFLEVPLVLVVRKDLPVNSMQEFVAYAGTLERDLRRILNFGVPLHTHIRPINLKFRGRARFFPAPRLCSPSAGRYCRQAELE